MSNPVRLPRRVRSFISTSFHHFGIHCASHPIRVILISAVVITSLFYPALALYSNSHPHALSSLYALFDAPTYRSDLKDVWQGHDALHVLEDSVQRTRCGLERTLRVERILVPSIEQSSAGAATPPTLQFALDLENAVHDFIKMTKSSLPCLPDIKKHDCFVLSPSALFRDGIPSTSKDILHTINHFRNLTLSDVPIDMSMLFSARFTSDDPPGIVDHVGFLVFSYFFIETDCASHDGHDQWMSLVHKATSRMSQKTSMTEFVFEKSRFLSLQYNSRPSHFSVISLFLYLSYLGIFVSFSGSLRRMDTVHSRFGLTFTGIIEIIASTIASVSVFALGGFRITMVPWGLLPLIIVFVGAENMFQLVDAVTSTSVTLSVKLRIGTGLAIAGTTNTLNTVSYNTILVLSIDLQRLELSDMLSQDKSKKVEAKEVQPVDPNKRKTMNRIQERLRVVPSKNGSLLLMLAATLVLYYATYPFPSRSKSEMDALSFLQRAMRRPSIQTDEPSLPAFKLWNMLNPENDPFVHIHIETPVIVAPNLEDSSEPGQDNRRQDPRNHSTTIRHLAWLCKILILPMGTTIGLLYLLLRYLLKGTDALEAYRAEPEDEGDSLQTPHPSPVEPSIKFSTLPRAFATDIELIAVNHDVSIIALVSTEDEVLIWNDGYHRLNVHDILYTASSGSETKVTISSITLDHQGRYCAIGTNSGTVAIWNIPSRKLSLDRVPHLMALTLPAGVTDLGFITPTTPVCKNLSLESIPQQDYRIVVACSNGGVFEINLHNTDVQSVSSSHPEIVFQSSLIRNHENGSVHVAFSYDDGMVELLSYDRAWRTICLIQAGHQTNPATQFYLAAIETREDNLIILAAATRTGVISLWNVSTGEALHVLDSSFGHVTQLRLGNYLPKTCKHCGELTPDAFILAFSVGQTVYVYRCAIPSLPKHCNCPVAKTHVTRDGFRFRSRSSSTTSTTSSPKRNRKGLPPMSSLSVGPDVTEFPVSGHGVHSRRVTSERELNRRASEILPITPEDDGGGGLALFRLPQGHGGDCNLTIEYMVDIGYERGGWDIVDGRWLCGVRRRSRVLKSPLSTHSSRETSLPSHRSDLTPSVLDRWELWTFDFSILDSNIKASTFLNLSHFSSTLNITPKNSEHPRLPFTRIFPVVIRSTACVAGLGNTTGILETLQKAKRRGDSRTYTPTLPNFPATPNLLHYDSLRSTFTSYKPSATMTLFQRAPSPALINKTKDSRIDKEIDDFLSSDLELSFASTMSLNSPVPSRAPSPMAMDISPAPVHQSHGFLAPPARHFGRDLLNTNSISSVRSTGTKSKSKGQQRAALPTEWMSSASGNKDTSLEGFNIPVVINTIPSSDAMDIDSPSNPPAVTYNEPSSPAAIPGLANGNYSNLFFDGSSPAACGSPPPKKRRSVSPEPNLSISSDPPSSPSHNKFARAATMGAAGSLFKKPTLEYNAPSSKRFPARRPTISALVSRTDSEQTKSAYSILNTTTEEPLPPPRRAFSAVIPPDQVLEPGSDDVSDVQTSSPAAAYAKRHHARVIRRCDGSEDLRPLHSAGSLRKRDREQVFENKGCSPKSLAGFGIKEVQKKLLPCHRVADDGLVRITSVTLKDLLSGAYQSRVASYTIVDCRFDYEYAGGHIPGAVNLNNTTAMEEYFLGSNKPFPRESGDPEARHVVIFHCEFSVKRAPTFAKHVRSKDRAINGRIYPKICYPEMYILEGGYSQFYKDFPTYCEPLGYVQMDDPAYTETRDADMDNFRRCGKWARTQSYTYGQNLNGAITFPSTSSNSTNHQAASRDNRKTAPSGGVNDSGNMFAAATAARGRRVGPTAQDLCTLEEDVSSSGLEEGDSIDLQESPCPPPSKSGGRLAALLPLGPGKNFRVNFDRAASFGPSTSLRR
ncbi:hypothetical protein Clacol_006199 [Clathrus columnatus]|uniref:M-phase inducer phosphatase n=1 Tax=Clathrus columnatus TaxID=1419009 RepID=A0AAV5AHJ9_9AGAM|nr:hypothetical protein Clacol_006199 [Clathrus columnatus]